MNCLEDARVGREVVAVGLCTHCGAAMCADHARECQVERVRSNGVGTPVVRVARILCCEQCQASGVCDGARSMAGAAVR